MLLRLRAQVLLLAISLFAPLMVANAQTPQFPARGFWNGYLDHSNVIECSNLSYDLTASLEITVYDNQGTELFSQPVTISPRGTSHSVLNHPGLVNSYGSYVVQSANSDGSLPIACITAIYRIGTAAQNRQIAYALALRMGEPLYGESSGIFNSFDPSGLGNPVFNWLSIFNQDSSSASFVVEVYAQDGSRDSSRTIRITNLKAGERRDFALGHEEGQKVGVYRVVPANGSQGYRAFLTRYGREDDSTFQFAFPLEAAPGSCEAQTVPASTMGNALNWGEVANVSGSPIQVNVQISNSLGQVLHQEILALSPYSQAHVFINEHLGEQNVGSFRVSCANENFAKILVQTMFYGRRAGSSQVVQWAYGSQLGNERLDAGVEFALATNTNLGAANWVKIHNPDDVRGSIEFTLYQPNGAQVVDESKELLGFDSLDLDVHSRVGTGAFGLARVATDTSLLPYAELLRVYPQHDGSIGTILRVPPIISRDNDGVISGDYVVFAYNDLGMHCMNDSFAEMMILPPANTLHATVIDRSDDEPDIVGEGIEVSYSIPGNSESASKTDFWEHSEALLGTSVPQDKGLSGKGMSGTMDYLMSQGRSDWAATFIPITPITDAGREDPYQLATVSVRKNGQLLAQTRAVVPVSWEMNCNLCHLGTGVSTATHILHEHDRLHATDLVNSKPVACGDCHEQEPLDLPGQAGVPSLSRAMHGSHASRMDSVLEQVGGLSCYACHPGIRTQCQRDIHSLRGMDCIDCHGSMSDVSAKDHPWQEEPRCQTCHESRRPEFDYEQAGTLYRNSKGHQGVHCAACHGSPHAIVPSRVYADNIQSVALQGHAGVINTCSVCHKNIPDDEFEHSYEEDD